MHASVQHDKDGRLLSDTISLGENRVDMIPVESAAIDSMFAMRPQSEEEIGDDVTELVGTTDDVYMPKWSSWITRHLVAVGFGTWLKMLDGNQPWK